MIHFRFPVIYSKASLPLAFLLIVALVIHIQFGMQAGIWFWLIACLVAFLYRDPRRVVPSLPLAVVAPVDGIVTSVEPVYDPFLNRSALRIQMTGSVTGVYTVRSVMEGKVQNQWFGRLSEKADEGIYAATGLPDYAQWTQSDEGDDVITTLSPKIKSTSVQCSASSGERIGQGKPCTFIPFGADAEVLLAENTRINVSPGDKIKAGSSVIATLVH